MPFAGIEAALIPWYAAHRPGARFVSETPSDLQTQVPLNQITSLGGGSDTSAPNRLRVIRWIVHTFANGNVAALAEAEAVRALTLGALRGASLTGADVTLTVEESAPSFVPYPDVAVRQYVHAYNAHILLS